MKSQKKITILIGIAGIILLGIVVLVIILQNQSIQKTDISTTKPTQQTMRDDSRNSNTEPIATTPIEKITVPPFEGYSEEYQKAQEEIDTMNKELLQQQNTAAALRNNLPLSRESFMLDYNYNSFEFVLTLPRDNQSQGMEEFELYLEENGIEDPSWLQQLRIETVSELEPVQPEDEVNPQQGQNTPQEETEQEDKITEEELLQIESL
jgi:hypothetical protein